MSEGPGPDVSREDELWLPVHRACRDGDVAAVASLLQQPQHRAQLTAEDPRFGWTPLHWAAHCGQLECVVHLVQMGCDVNAVTSRFSQTPAHTAAFGGQPHCVVWLTQAGADVNKQDFIGEAPIHKAARSGSLECIQVLLIAGAKPHLRNASGQTAADLAQMHSYHDCFRFVSKAQRHQLLQPAGLHGNAAANGNGVLSRKRLLAAAVDGGHIKKPRSADHILVQVQSIEAEEQESMSTESAQEIHSDEPPITNGFHPLPSNPESAKSLTSPPSNQQLAPAQRPASDTCGSLHLSGSPSSCVSHRPAWWGTDFGDFLHYGHYHGFGDTAEELCDGSSSCHDNSSSVQAERVYKQAVAVHLYHGS